MNSRESIGHLISCIHRHAQRYFNLEFSKLGLGSGNYMLLLLLYHHENETQHELSNKMHCDKANTARAIQKLLELGYITKERDPEDHRAFRIHLTEKAQKIKPEIKKILRSWTDIISDGFSDEEKKIAIEILNHMTANAVKYINKQSDPPNKDSL